MEVVSVIIPAFNAARHLDECLLSLRGQTYTALDLMVIDDGSTDETAAIAAKHAAADHRLRLFRQDNAGVSVARNRGIAAARGEYLSFFDADDVMYPHSVQIRVEACKRSPSVDLVYADRMVVNDDRSPLRKSVGVAMVSRPLVHLLQSPCMGTSVVMMRRDAIGRCGIFDATLTHYEDWDLWLRCAEAGFSFRYVPVVIDEYRRHDANATLKLDVMLNQGLAMLARHQPPAADAEAMRAWRQGCYGLMQCWLWSLWAQPRSRLWKAWRIAMRSLTLPGLPVAFARVALKSAAKRLRRVRGAQVSPA